MSETGENRIGLASFVWLRSPAVSRHAGKVTMQEIEKYLKGDDVYCTVLAYVVRGGGMTTAREVPNVFGASRALPFELCDEAWPTSIDMTEFRIGSAPARRIQTKIPSSGIDMSSLSKIFRFEVGTRADSVPT